MATAAASTVRLADLLVREGLITRDQLDQALVEQKNTGMRLGYCLVKLGFVQELEITKALARQYKMPAVDLSRFEVDPKIIKLVPADVAVKHMVLPLKREGRTLTVAVADPTNHAVVDDLKFITRYDVFPVIAGEYTLRTAIERYYEQTDAQLQSLLKDIEDTEDLEVIEEKDEDAPVPTQVGDDAPVVKLINGILTDAVKRGASDIHIEPFEHAGQRVLWPRGAAGGPALALGLREAGARVDDVVVYRTVPAPFDAPALAAALADGSLQALTFASPSAARSFAAGMGEDGMRVARAAVVAAIGRVTASALAELGLPADAVAESPAPAALVTALASAFERREERA